MSEERYWECSKIKCKWIGTDAEKSRIPDENFPTFAESLVCPKCGNEAFYETDKKKHEKYLAKEKADKINSDEKTRLDFEDWATDKGFILDQVFMKLGGVPQNPYMSEDTKIAFEIWCESRKSYEPNNDQKEIYCHECSKAGGAERAIYHLPPVCK